jgi:glycosyltransferase involved in cell wall biosynthesis
VHWYFGKVPLVKSLAPLPLRQIEWSRAFYREAARVAAEDKIDVIEATEVGSLFLHRIAPLVIRLHGSERTFREHSGIPLNSSVRWNDVLEARAGERAAAITAPSQFHANEMSRRRNWPRERFSVIPNPISQTVIDASRKFERNGNTEQTVLYAGRLAPVKGIETLLSAAKLVLSKNPAIKFVLAGPWQMPQPPENFGLNGNGKPNGIRWVGPQTPAELIKLYQAASAVVVPSNYESFGISALEAKAFGAAVVATNAGALPEIVEKENLVPANNPAALSEAIIGVLANGSSRETTAVREAFLQKYAPAQIAQQTIDLYESVVRGQQ